MYLNHDMLELVYLYKTMTWKSCKSFGSNISPTLSQLEDATTSEKNVLFPLYTVGTVHLQREKKKIGRNKSWHAIFIIPRIPFLKNEYQ